MSRDLDLICRRAEDVRALVRALSEIARQAGVEIELLRDAGTFLRATIRPHDARSSSLRSTERLRRSKRDRH